MGDLSGICFPMVVSLLGFLLFDWLGLVILVDCVTFMLVTGTFVVY